MVINYDLPNEVENYVHRIGRTARAGKKGKAYTFCSEQDVYSLPPIERYIEKQIPSQVADESLMAEDKSKDTYIKLDSYHEEYNDRSEFGKRRQAEYDRTHGSRKRSGKGRRTGDSGRYDNGGRYDPKRGSGRYSIRNEERGKDYKRDRRVFSAEEEAALATMSTEERMKIYREKFGGKNINSSAANSSKNTQGKNFQSKKNAKYSKNKSGAKSKAPVQQTKKEEKKGFLSAIKAFFGRK